MNQASKPSHWWRRTFFSIISIAFLAAALYFSFFIDEPHYPMTAIWLTFCLFAFAIGWPEMVESISFLGSSMKLRAVKSAINELKILAKVQSEVTLELIQAKNRFSSFFGDYEQKMYDSIENMLTKFGFKSEEIKKIQLGWHNWVEHDYISNLITNSIDHHEIPEDKRKKWELARKDIQEKIKNINSIHIQPDELRSIFKELGGYKENVKTIIDDLEYYKKNKKHRDLEQWKNRQKWFQ